MGLISRVSSRTYRIFIKKTRKNNKAQDWGAEEAEDDIQEVQMKEVLIFNKWSVSDVRCEDLSLKDYINVSGNYAKYLPHTAGRYDKIRFRKAQCPIIERLINSLMKTGRNNGKKMLTMRIVNHACDVSPLRRVNQAIWLICTGARNAAFRNTKSMSECLADELMNAAKGSSNSYAIKKKDELERVAKSNR